MTQNKSDRSTDANHRLMHGTKQRNLSCGHLATQELVSYTMWWREVILDLFLLQFNFVSSSFSSFSTSADSLSASNYSSHLEVGHLMPYFIDRDMESYVFSLTVTIEQQCLNLSEFQYQGGSVLHQRLWRQPSSLVRNSLLPIWNIITEIRET